MKRAVYIWKGEYPWDVRAEKMCNALATGGFEVWMLARRGSGQAETENIGGINVIRVGSDNKSYKSAPVSYNPFWRAAIERFVKEYKPDLIMPRDIMLAEAAADAGRKRDIPVIMDMAEHYPAAMKAWKKYREKFVRRILVHTLNVPELVERRAVAGMNGIITVCEEQIGRLEKQYGFPKDKTTVVHNTPANDLFESVEKGCSAPPRVFGHHGNTTDEKKLDLLVKGFDLFAEKNADAELLIAGEGESFPALRELADSCKHRDRITLTGKYHYDELTSIMNRIDIGVIPYKQNLFNEYTIHNKIFDYFTCGKPVISTPMGPTKRVLEETGAGFSIKGYSEEMMASGLEKMVGSDIENYSKRAFEAAANKYNWDRDKEKLLSYLKDYC